MLSADTGSRCPLRLGASGEGNLVEAVALRAVRVGSDSEARLFGEVPIRATVSDRLARRLLLRQIESAGVPGQLLASW
jgi:hypothetical protein